MPVVTCEKCGMAHFIRSENSTQDNGTLCKKCLKAKRKASCGKKATAGKAKALAVKTKPKATYVPCQICGKEFYVRPARIKMGKDKYCSRKCISEARRRADTVSCPWCGKHFVKRAGQIYCSRSCAALANHASHERVGVKKNECIICGTEFKHGVSSKVCSNECLVAYRKGVGIQCHNYSLDADPWETGAIPPDRFAPDMYRQPDPVLGF